MLVVSINRSLIGVVMVKGKPHYIKTMTSDRWLNRWSRLSAKGWLSISKEFQITGYTALNDIRYDMCVCVCVSAATGTYIEYNNDKQVSAIICAVVTLLADVLLTPSREKKDVVMSLFFFLLAFVIYVCDQNRLRNMTNSAIIVCAYVVSVWIKNHIELHLVLLDNFTQEVWKYAESQSIDMLGTCVLIPTTKITRMNSCS